MTQETTENWNAWTTRRDERAFEALVRPELPHALGFARRLGCSTADAEDALQDALARLAGVRDDAPVALGVRAWLCREVHVRARSRLRSERRRRVRQVAAAVDERRVESDSTAARDEVERALAALDETGRRAVELRYLHDLDYREMAFVLGVSEGACRKRVHHALARLRERFGRDAAALVAALPLPSVPDASALVTRGLAKATVGSAAIGGAAVMATTIQKMAVVAVVAAALGAGFTFAVQRGAAPEALSPPSALPEEIAKRDAEIASLRTQLAASVKRRDAERREDAAPAELPRPATASTPSVSSTGLDSIAWDRVSSALLRSAKAMRSRERPDAELMVEFGKLLQQLGSMKDQLGGGSPTELLAHPEVEARLLGAIAKTLAPKLTDAERDAFQAEVRSAVAAAARDRPQNVAPLVRVDYDLSASDAIRGILARRVGAELADATEGLTFGAPGEPAYGTTYVVAAARSDVVKAIVSYWTEAVKLDDAQTRAAEQIAASWADAVAAVRERAVREFGEETTRAALTEPPKDAAADPLGATRRDPVFSARHRTIVGWIRSAQAKCEDRFFQTLSSEQKKDYVRETPEVLLFSTGR